MTWLPASFPPTMRVSFCAHFRSWTRRTSGAVSLRLTEAPDVMAAPTSRRRAGPGPCRLATTRAHRLRALAALRLAALVAPRPVGPAVPLPVDLAVLRPVVLMELLPAPPRLARLARGLRVALVALLLVVEPVGLLRRAPVAKALRRRRF